MMLDRVTADDIVGQLPTPAHLQGVLPARVDLFIGALGFEERCTAAVQMFAASSVPVDRALLAVYPRNTADNERQRPALEGALSYSGAEILWADTDPDGYLEALVALLQSSAGAAWGVCVDISSMSGSLILGTLRALSRYPELVVKIVYTEALQYGPSLEQYQNELKIRSADGIISVDHGVGSIRFSVDFEGSHVPGLSDLVVVVPGFSRDRVRAAISYVNPAYLLAPNGHVRWIVGRPSTQENEWRESALRELHGIGATDVWDVVDDFDYRAMILSLERLYLDSQFKANVTVAPFGTKLHSVAVGLHCLMRPATRVLVVEPQSYRTQDYSRGVGTSWSIDLGTLGTLGASLRSVDRLVAIHDD